MSRCPPSEAFRIEYWQLEEAKIRRQPPEKELSRHVVLIVGGGSGIGREAALLAAQRGAHVVVADRDHEAAKKVAEEAKEIAGKEAGLSVAVDIRRREVIRQSLRDLVAAYGGLDILINTAALFPSSKDGQITDEQWGVTLDVNVTANYLLADEAARILKDQNLDASIVLTSSANAVVPKRGSEAYDVSKAALSHLVRELAISLSPKIRVNGISPATVIKGSTMFPRDRVIASLKKYEIAYERHCQRRRVADSARRVLCQANTDPSPHRSERLCGSDSVSGGAKIALHHRPHCSRGWWSNRGFPAMSEVSARSGSEKQSRLWSPWIWVPKAVAFHCCAGVMVNRKFVWCTASPILHKMRATACAGISLPSCEGVEEGLRACARLAPEGIAAIGVDGWAVDYVRLGAEGKPVANPFCYRDERTVAGQQQVHSRISPDRLYELTGVQIISLNTLYQLRADGPNEQSLPWINLPEFLLYQLGGKRVSEYTNATHTQLLGVQDQSWCPEIFAAAGLDVSAAPPLVKPGTDIGDSGRPRFPAGVSRNPVDRSRVS